MSLLVGCRYRSADGQRIATIRHLAERRWLVTTAWLDHPLDHRIRRHVERVESKSLTHAQGWCREYCKERP